MQKVAFEKLLDFFAQSKKLHYKKGEVILRSEDPPRGIFFIDKGYVREHSLSSAGKEFTLIIYKPEDFFPLNWALHKTPYTYYLEAITHVEAYCANRESFVQFIHENPDVLFELTSRIVTRLGGLMTRMEYLVFGTAFAKVASIIVICAERFGDREGKSIIIKFPFTHKVIANLIGISRETASIEVKKIERLGLIGYRGRHLVIKNLTKLKEVALITENN